MAELRIQLRRGTAAQWTSANPVLGEAEFGIETDTLKFKVGNGTTPWNDIDSYFEPTAVDLDTYITATELSTELEDYLTTSSASSNYLTKTSASSTYLTQTNASSTYQTQAAMSLYATLSGATFTGSVVLNADPTLALGAATKQYVDNVASGILTKPSVKAASTVNVAGTYNNGTLGVGATLTIPATATLTIDGVSSWDQYDGILLKNQTDAAENGRWVMLTIGDAETAWVLRRCGLCDEASEIPGAYMFVTDGNTNAGTGWVLVVADPETFTVGTDDINVYEFTSSTTYTAGDGITIIENAIAVSSDVVRDGDLTNYVTTTSTSTLTNKTLTSPTITSPVITSASESELINPSIKGPVENVTYSASVFTSPLNLDISTTSVAFADANMTANLTVNVRWSSTATLASKISSGESVTAVVIVKNGTTPYYINTFQIDGVTVTPRWLDNSAPSSGTANRTHVYSYVINRTPSNTWVVLASRTLFGV